MKIVEVKVYPFNDQSGRAKAFARIMISLDKTGETHMTINSCKVVEGNKGLFVALPSYPKPDGQGWDSPLYIDFKTDTGKRFLDYLSENVLEEFRRSVADTPPSQPQLAADDDDDIPF